MQVWAVSTQFCSIKESKTIAPQVWGPCEPARVLSARLSPARATWPQPQLPQTGQHSEEHGPSGRARPGPLPISLSPLLSSAALASPGQKRSPGSPVPPCQPSPPAGMLPHWSIPERHHPHLHRLGCSSSTPANTKAAPPDPKDGAGVSQQWNNKFLQKSHNESTLPFTQSHSWGLKRGCLELQHATLKAFLEIKTKQIHFPSYHIWNVPQIQIIIHGGKKSKKKNQNESKKTFYSYQPIPAKYTDVQYQNKPPPTASELEN